MSIIRKLYPTALLYGIDMSEEMLKKAEEKKIDNLNLYLGDAEHLPFENARFGKQADVVLRLKRGELYVEINEAGCEERSFLRRKYFNAIISAILLNFYLINKVEV